MSLQTFQTGPEPQIRVLDCTGNLAIQVWDESAVEVAWSGEASQIDWQESGVIVARLHGDLRLRAPTGASIRVERQQGDVAASGVASVMLSAIAGGVTLADIAGTAQLRDIAGDCQARAIGEALRFGEIGGAFEVQSSPAAAVVGSRVGGNLTVSGATSLEIGDVGGNASVSSVAAGVRVGTIGGDGSIGDVRGMLSIGTIEGNASLRRIEGTIRLGHIGGDMDLVAGVLPESRMLLTVGGTARINLPDHPSLTVQAIVGGTVRGTGIGQSGGGMITLVYGDGATRLRLLIGGDLELQGGDLPRISFAPRTGWTYFDEEIGRLGAELGRELGQMGAELGAELGQMGTELGHEMAEMFGSWGWLKSQDWSHRAERHAARLGRKIEKHLRRAEAQARKAEAQAERRGSRSKQEWGETPFDREQLERLREQARRAAREGIEGALEAVERALTQMGFTPPPPPDHAPTPATGPTIRFESQQAPASGQTPPPPSERPDDEERLAILRMVAERRISPEEADRLLEALDHR